VTESVVSSLAAAGNLGRDNHDVLVDVRAVCPDYSVVRPVGELLREGGCGCAD
jgi:hypothetical protein